jgi:hypothetical protein
MIGHIYKVPINALTVASGTKTIAQLVTGATRRLWILGLSLSAKSVNATDVPFRAEFVRQTGAGTSGTTITPLPLNDDHPAAIFTVNNGYTVEPSDGNAIVGGPFYISPVGGLYTEQFPEGWEIQQRVSQRTGLRIVTVQSIDIVGHVWVLE